MKSVLVTDTSHKYGLVRVVLAEQARRLELMLTPDRAGELGSDLKRLALAAEEQAEYEEYEARLEAAKRKKGRPR